MYDEKWYNISCSKTYIAHLMYLLSFFALLSAGYLLFVIQKYDYVPWFYADFSLLNLIESMVMLLFSFHVLMKIKSEALRGLFGILYLFIVPPTLCYYVFVNLSPVFIYGIVGGFVLTIVSYIVFSNALDRSFREVRQRGDWKHVRSALPVRTTSKVSLVAFFLLLPAVVFGSLFYHNGLPTLTALNLLAVYDVREGVTYGHSLIVYFANWQSNVIVPVLIVAGIYKERYSLAIAGIGMQFVLFLYTGHKSTLFSIFFVLAIYVLSTDGTVVLGLLKVFNIVIAGSMKIFWLFAELLPGSLFIRRVFFIPAAVRGRYVEFFSENEPMRMADTSLGFLSTNPHSQHAPALIGEEFFSGANANVGYLASAFADFNVVGIVLFAIIVGLLFSIVRELSRSLDPIIVLGIWIIPTFSLASSRASTVFLTHGFLFACVVAILLKESLVEDVGR